MRLCLALAVLAGFTMHATGEPVPVILDTDLGDDIDDTWALAMMLGLPEQIDLKLVVTASDNTPIKTRLTAKILEKMGHGDVPLGMGKQTSDNPINQESWIGDYDVEDYPGAFHEDGVQALIDMIMASEEMITLCVIGPQTNIAEALKREPEIAKKARVVAMAGSVYVGYQGKPEPQPEWNVLKDVAAARAVFAAPWEVVYAPLDVCGTLTLEGARYEAVANSEHPLAKVTIENYEGWKNRKHYAANASSVLFDTTAIYLCYADALMKTETVKLSLDDKGLTYPDPENGRPVICALDWNDREGFEKLLVEALTGE
jgi:inosine-uridine nucleoside N-ribohydrolase